MYKIYLTTEDLLKANQLPVTSLINEAYNADIIEFMEALVQGIGSGYNYSSCSFWNDLDEYEQANTPRFDGIWVNNEGGEKVTMSYKDLLYYLETLYVRLNIDNFERLDELRTLLDSFKETFCQDC